MILSLSAGNFCITLLFLPWTRPSLNLFERRLDYRHCTLNLIIQNWLPRTLVLRLLSQGTMTSQVLIAFLLRLNDNNYCCHYRRPRHTIENRSRRPKFNVPTVAIANFESAPFPAANFGEFPRLTFTLSTVGLEAMVNQVLPRFGSSDKPDTWDWA